MESTEEAAGSPTNAENRGSDGLMINNQSVQKIDEAGHLQENDASSAGQPNGQQNQNVAYSNGNAQSSSAAFGMGYPSGSPNELNEMNY